MEACLKRADLIASPSGGGGCPKGRRRGYTGEVAAVRLTERVHGGGGCPKGRRRGYTGEVDARRADGEDRSNKLLLQVPAKPTEST